MKKTILLFLSIVTFFTVTNAQTESDSRSSSVIFSVGPDLSFPIGNNVVEYSFIAGLSAQVEYSVSPVIGITANAGYLNYSYKTVAGSGNQGFVPLLGGVKFYISPRAFFHMQAGAAFATSSISDGANGVFLKSGTFFAYSPGIGHKFGKNLEGEAKFFGISNSDHNHINSFGIRLGYIF